MNLLRQLLTLVLVAALATGCAARRRGGVQSLPEPPTVQEVVAQTEQRLAVEVHMLGIDPEVPQHVGKRTTFGDVAEEDVRRLLPTFEEVLATYPDDARARLIGHVWFVGTLKIGDVPFRGMAHSSGRFELALRPRTRPIDLFGTMHHEIGHLFELSKAFDRQTWRAFSEGSYVGMQPDRKWDPKVKGQPWLPLGFVSKYASKNIHEDFAEMAELGFTRPDILRKYHERFPLIRAKLDFLTSEYLRLAPGIVLPWYGQGWADWRLAHPRNPPARRRSELEDAPPDV